jgi:nucleoside-diphosphate-sugar epimerase
MRAKRIVITGAAGLVGQNLIHRLKLDKLNEIVAIDKHRQNTVILRQLHPEVHIVEADIAERGPWEQELEGCTDLVIGHAQIGGLLLGEYERNNVQASERLLEAALRYKVPYAVNISSSVVNSMAIDFYTETKKAQEALTLASGIRQVILRPTLMFGWFDRKHIGWLARFMQRVRVFPVPGDGKYLRQPLYAGDFCDIIASALETKITGAYNITGQQRIGYIDLIYALKDATGARTHIVKVPYRLFWLMLKANALVDKDPPFTSKQLEALVTPDVFEVIDWPGIFGVRSTPLLEALEKTFRHPEYSKIALHY